MEHPLLSGIVGSTAYGLATPNSDVDRLGVFAYTTNELVGLHRPKESIVTNEPDVTRHEAGKYAALALKCNPTVMELLWLPDELYELRTALGRALIDIRTAFLSKEYVRNAYLGYATQQFKRLESRGDGSFSADTRKRTAKHARHLARLVDQGLVLHTEGRLPIKVGNPQALHDFGEQVAAGDLDLAKNKLEAASFAFDLTESVLPEKPDTARVEAWLQSVRRAMWEN
jgi:predicted nucleotidyltransferase